MQLTLSTFDFAQAVDRFLLGDTIATAQTCPCHKFSRMCVRQSVRMIFHERDHTVVVGAIGIMKIRFVYENRRLRRARLRSSRAVRPWVMLASGCSVADVNQTRFRRIKHFRQIMLKAAGQWHFDDLSAIGSSIMRMLQRSGPLLQASHSEVQ